MRARNFVKKLNKTPGNYAHNMEILAAKAGVHPKQMWYINPVTFAEREFTPVWERQSAAIIKLLGADMYDHFCQERAASYSFSRNFAYHKREPIPAYSPWNWQIQSVKDFYAQIEAAPHGPQRVRIFGELFSFFLRNESFLRSSPKMCDATAQKVAEFKADPLTEPIRDTLDAVEAMLARIRPPAPAPAFRVGDYVWHTPETKARLGITEEKYGRVNMVCQKGASYLVTSLPPRSHYLASEIELVPAADLQRMMAPEPQYRFRIGDYVQLSPAGRETSMKTISFMSIRGVDTGRVTDRFMRQTDDKLMCVFTVERNKLYSNYETEDLEPATDVAQAMLEAATPDWSADSTDVPTCPIQAGTAVRLSPAARERYGVPSYSEDFGVVSHIYTVHGREIAAVPSLRPQMHYNVMELEIIDPPPKRVCPFPIGSYVELSEAGRQKPSNDSDALGSWLHKRTARVTDTYPSDWEPGYCVVVSHDGELHSEYHEEDLMAVDQVTHLTDIIRRLEKRIVDLEAKRT